MRLAASLQRLLVPLVLRVLPLGGIELGDAGGVGFLYLAPDDLHGAVYHAVLLGERLGEDGEGGRLLEEPSFTVSAVDAGFFQ